MANLRHRRRHHGTPRRQVLIHLDRVGVPDERRLPVRDDADIHGSQIRGEVVIRTRAERVDVRQAAQRREHRGVVADEHEARPGEALAACRTVDIEPLAAHPVSTRGCGWHSDRGLGRARLGGLHLPRSGHDRPGWIAVHRSSGRSSQDPTARRNRRARGPRGGPRAPVIASRGRRPQALGAAPRRQDGLHGRRTKG